MLVRLPQRAEQHRLRQGAAVARCCSLIERLPPNSGARDPASNTGTGNARHMSCWLCHAAIVCSRNVPQLLPLPYFALLSLLGLAGGRLGVEG